MGRFPLRCTNITLPVEAASPQIQERMDKTSMHDPDNETIIQNNKHEIWEQIKAVDELPIYPAIVQQVLITTKEEEYYDRDLDYEEKYTEWLELRQGFIVAHFDEKKQLLGVGDCVILDIEKHILLRAPRVSRRGLVIPMISYQGHISQPLDYLTYYETILNLIKEYKASPIKGSLRY